MAMNLGEDLVSLGKHLGSLAFKAIITMSGGLSLEEKAFLEVKNALFNQHKALIIKGNQDSTLYQSKRTHSQALFVCS